MHRYRCRALNFGFFFKFFAQCQKLDSTVDVASDVIFRSDFKSSLQKYDFCYILRLLNASLLMHQLFSAGYFSKSFCHFQWRQRLTSCSPNLPILGFNVVLDVILDRLFNEHTCHRVPCLLKFSVAKMVDIGLLSSSLPLIFRPKTRFKFWSYFWVWPKVVCARTSLSSCSVPSEDIVTRATTHCKVDFAIVLFLVSALNLTIKSLVLCRTFPLA